MLLIWALAILATFCNAQEITVKSEVKLDIQTTAQAPAGGFTEPTIAPSEAPLGAAAAASAGFTGLPLPGASSAAPLSADPFAEAKPANATGEKKEEPKEGAPAVPPAAGAPTGAPAVPADGAPPKEGETKEPPKEGEPKPQEGAPKPQEGVPKPLEGAPTEAPKDPAAPKEEAPKDGASPKPLEAPKDSAPKDPAAPTEAPREGAQEAPRDGALPTKEGEPKAPEGGAPKPEEPKVPEGAPKPEDPRAKANGTQLELELEPNATAPIEPLKPKDGNLTAPLEEKKPLEQPLGAQPIPLATNQSIPLPVKPLENNESSVDLGSIPKAPKNESELITDLLINGNGTKEGESNSNSTSQFLLPSKIEHIRLTIIGFTGKPVHTFNLTEAQVLYQMKVFWGEPESWQDIGNKPTDRLYELFCWLTVHGGYARDLFRGNLSASLDQHSQWYAFPESEDPANSNISVNCGLRPVNAAAKGGDWSFADPAPVREAPVFLRGFENVNVRGWTKQEVIRLVRNQKRQDQPTKSKSKSKNRRATL